MSEITDLIITEPTLSVIVLNYKNRVLTSKCVNYVIHSVEKANINTVITAIAQLLHINNNIKMV